MSPIEIETTIPINKEAAVSAVITSPETGFRPEKWAVILAHGAGNDKNHDLLLYLANGLAKAGHLAVRFNFPYRDEGRKGPDGQKKLEKTWTAAFDFVRNHPNFKPKKVVAAGKSMGGRVASQLQAAGGVTAQRMIFYGYPLHAPGKRNEPRSSHFKNISAPSLFFAGTRDSLCDLKALNRAIEELAGPVELEIVEGGDHSFKTPKSMDIDPKELHEAMLKKTLLWLEEDF